MENSEWAAALILVGGLALLLQGTVTLFLSMPAYLLYQVPIGAYRFVLAPISLDRFLIIAGVAVAQILIAYVIISCAALVYARKFGPAKTRTSLAIVAAFTAILVEYIASVVSYTYNPGNITFLSLFEQTATFTDWGFVAVVAGALLAKWEITRKGDSL